MANTLRNPTFFENSLFLERRVKTGDNLSGQDFYRIMIIATSDASLNNRTLAIDLLGVLSLKNGEFGDEARQKLEEIEALRIGPEDFVESSMALRAAGWLIRPEQAQDDFYSSFYSNFPFGREYNKLSNPIETVVSRVYPNKTTSARKVFLTNIQAKNLGMPSFMTRLKRRFISNGYDAKDSYGNGRLVFGDTILPVSFLKMSGRDFHYGSGIAVSRSVADELKVVPGTLVEISA